MRPSRGALLAGAAQVFFLPLPYQAVEAPPPLAAGSRAQPNAVELENPGRIASDERVRVALGPDGRPVAVAVEHRLRVRGTGDYSFVVPAPATAVAPAPGTESLPGLRDVGVVWQGFADRTRLLALRAELRVGPASAALPLAVTVARSSSGTRVTLANATARAIAARTGRAPRGELLALLRRLRVASRGTTRPETSMAVRGRPGPERTLRVAAPLRVTGTLAAGRVRRRVDRLLAGGRRPSASWTLPATGPPRLDLRVRLLDPLEILPAPARLARAPDPLATLSRAAAEIAVAGAYHRFLRPPDPGARAVASYAYRSGAPRAAPAAAAPLPGAAAAGRAGGGGVATALAILAGLLAAGGLAALWARS